MTINHYAVDLFIGVHEENPAILDITINIGIGTAIKTFGELKEAMEAAERVLKRLGVSADINKFPIGQPYRFDREEMEIGAKITTPEKSFHDWYDALLKEGFEKASEDHRVTFWAMDIWEGGEIQNETGIEVAH